MLTFRKNYFVAALILFVVELGIALFVRDQFIRPYMGDFLVVILIYCFIRAFLSIRIWVVAGFTLAFAIFVECLQAINIVELIGLGENQAARVILGTSFDWHDIGVYIGGVVFVLCVELVLRNRAARQ